MESYISRYPVQFCILWVYVRVLVAFLTSSYIEYGAGVKPETCIKSLHICSQYSVIWFVINLMTGFWCTNQLWTKFYWAQWANGWCVGWWLELIQYMYSLSWQLSMVMLFNLDCLFKITTITDFVVTISGRGLWWYALTKYLNPQWYPKTLVLGLHRITRWLHKIMQMSSSFDYVNIK